MPGLNARMAPSMKNSRIFRLVFLYAKAYNIGKTVDYLDSEKREGHIMIMSENRSETIIRTARAEDASEIREIYAPYVEKTAVTFEYEVPSVEEFRSRIEHTLQKYPYIVAEENGEILGYAYTGAFVGRAAYDWSAETTIYLKQNKQKMGLGKKLYEVLELISKAQNICNLNACIGYPEVEDDYLTNNSVQFHGHVGYDFAGKFHNCGYKFGTWYHMVWMEKALGVHPNTPLPLVRFPELSNAQLRKCGVTISR